MWKGGELSGGKMSETTPQDTAQPRLERVQPRRYTKTEADNLNNFT